MTTLHKPHHHIVVNVNDPEEVVNAARRSSVTGDFSDEENELSTQRCSSSSTEIKERRSSSVSELDLERCGDNGDGGVMGDDCKLSHSSKAEIVCRICHLSLDSTNQESGVPIELGCSCKDDLAAAHKHCAEAWFKIKGNKTCEICGSLARNIPGATEAEVVEQWNETNDSTQSTTTAAPVHTTETRHFWQGHQFLNFLLACMVFAFVISWLFHFNVPS